MKQLQAQQQQAIDEMKELYLNEDFVGLQTLYNDCLAEAQIEYHFNGSTPTEQEWLQISIMVNKRMDWIAQAEIASFYPKQTVTGASK